MLNANHMVAASHLPTASYANDAMLDELSKQLAAANNSRRLSRGSGSQRIGNAMRIVKPGSANNSPRSNTMQSRRRTLIGEGQQRPHLQPVDASYLPTPMYELNCEPMYEPEKRPARPVSWHPSSLQIPQQQYQQQCAAPCNFVAYDADQLANCQQFPPTPTAYSAYNSPSAFSPLTLPYSNLHTPQYYSPSTRSLHAQSQAQLQPQPQAQQHQQISSYQVNQSPSYSTGTTSSSSSSSGLPYLPAPRLPTTAGGALDWEAFAAQGFDRYAAPPTPEDFVVHHQPLQKLETTAPLKVAPEETIPYQPLDDDESEGEILYGMGLYDAPDVDSAVDFHRSTVFSLLGCSATQTERMGKGLKLEDAWEPPASDDDDEEEDAEGEDQE
jgi:hypothetical protein